MDFRGRTILHADEEGTGLATDGIGFCCGDDVEVTGTEEVKGLCDQDLCRLSYQYWDLPEWWQY